MDASTSCRSSYLNHRTLSLLINRLCGDISAKEKECHQDKCGAAEHMTSLYESVILPSRFPLTGEDP
jgi:hypothetical protein